MLNKATLAAKQPNLSALLYKRGRYCCYRAVQETRDEGRAKCTMGGQLSKSNAGSKAKLNLVFAA